MSVKLKQKPKKTTQVKCQDSSETVGYGNDIQEVIEEGEKTPTVGGNDFYDNAFPPVPLVRNVSM